MLRTFQLIGQIFFLPHFILFLTSPNKQKIREDLIAANSDMELEQNVCSVLTFELLTNRYFRTLFYFRTHGIISKFLRVFYPKHASFIIDINTKIEGGLRLAHPYSTIINAYKLKRNVYINHLVTIGEKNGKKPTIGNNVEIHANATIIGGITIGDNAVVGAGAVVVKDVPENTIVVGNPARILRRMRD